jgi:hypothetical protein
MSGKVCMAADGSSEGKPCKADKTCTGVGLTCVQETGFCKFVSDGKLNSPCKPDDKDSCKAYPGLHCASDNTCQCTADSNVFDLCDENSICVVGGSNPSPGPGPTSQWPDQQFPGPSDLQRSQFTGKCTDSSSWYKGNCPSGQLGAKLGDTTTSQCITSDNWSKGIAAGSYKQYCFVP